MKHCGGGGGSGGGGGGGGIPNRSPPLGDISVTLN